MILPRRKLLRLAAPALILPWRRAEAQFNQHARFAVTTQSTAAAAGFVFKDGGPGQGLNAPTTNPLNMTNANLFVVSGRYSGGYTPGLTDSVGTNTYTFVTGFPLTLGSGNKFGMWYCYAPSVSGSMTFSFSGSNVFGTIVVMGFSGAAASPQDQIATTLGWTAGPPGQITPGSITPGQPNELVISTVVATETGSTYSLTGGFSAPTYIAGNGTEDGAGMAYLIQNPGPSSANPTWSMTNAVGPGGGANVSFK